MSDSSQASMYGYFQRTRFRAMRVDMLSPMGTLLEPVSGVERRIRYRRPKSAPVRRTPMANGQMRHRAWAPPPGGRQTLQEHLNIWGPVFGANNVPYQQRFTSEMRRQYTGRQLAWAGPKPTPEAVPKPKPEAPSTQKSMPSYMRNTASRGSKVRPSTAKARLSVTK